MNKINIFLRLVIILFFLTSCGMVKKGFQNPKKSNSDEFLVEKKSPLVMPPEFNKLPVPKKDDGIEEDQNKDVQNLIIENFGISETKTSESDLEKSILGKIKSN